jgi:hypothetical protein
MRDPKREPAAGDLVCVGFEARQVIEITAGGAVRYRGDRHEGLCSLGMWRVWCRGTAAYRMEMKAPAGRGSARQ